jgi:hypothetical protein
MFVRRSALLCVIIDNGRAAPKLAIDCGGQGCWVCVSPFHAGGNAHLSPAAKLCSGCRGLRNRVAAGPCRSQRTRRLTTGKASLSTRGAWLVWSGFGREGVRQTSRKPQRHGSLVCRVRTADDASLRLHSHSAAMIRAGKGARGQSTATGTSRPSCLILVVPEERLRCPALLLSVA